MDASPIYAGLRTNVPKKLMAYHRRPFVTDDPASDFPPAHKVSSYLLEAARGLDSVIQFNSQVLPVAHLPRILMVVSCPIARGAAAGSSMSSPVLPLSLPIINRRLDVFPAISSS
ncbi:hypothetical protein PCANC_13185 [Puccinia coronata f. sp. avenae]|uniref:Uncharacterized protein n=1 Tax=Puccinia coronata f. sp. avenae TaxID=200324 RepID=A0A2N5UVA2_9BASI|nr:hypothetical protein PCANC_13185 [Puccinia coronata f. sp. avenae]